jgi:predicted PurR-regulated permease PerM/ABC-type Mn2+/Zn2+ transport system ATPase subunit
VAAPKSETGTKRSPGQSPDDLQVGVASERLRPDDARRIIIAMVAGSPPKLQIPRWIQLVTLPLLLLLIWAVAGAVRHVVFLFLVAGLIALLLNPLVRGVTRFWIPRGLGVAIVYLLFAGLVAAASIALGSVIVDQTRSSSHRVDSYFTTEHGQPPQTHAERDVDRLQVWLNDHGLSRIKIRKQLNDFVNNIRTKDVQKYTTEAINFVEGAAIGTVKLLFSLVLVLVVSIYMLLDMERLSAAVNRRFPPPDGSPPLMVRIERALVGYVKGQLLLSLIIGLSAGLGLWLLGFLGLVPGLEKYAVVFGAWVAFTELIPYLGPWLGAIPPFVYALIVHPISALGRPPLPLHPPDRGPRRRSERDGVGPAAASPARHLRLACRRRDLRAAWGAYRSAPAGGVPGDLGVLLRTDPARALGRDRRRRATTGSGRRRTARTPDRDQAPQGRAAVNERGPLLVARAAARRYGSQIALEPTGFELRDGEAVALVGPNGAGKSTLLALLAGALEPSEGRIERRDGVQIGWAPQRAAQYARLSPRENLELFARLEADERPEQSAERLLDEFELPRNGVLVGELSVGNRQRLNLAIALLGEPDALLLDEPTAALDPEQRQRLWGRLEAQREAGVALLFVTQQNEEVKAHADRVVVLREGAVAFAGPLAEYDALALAG